MPMTDVATVNEPNGATVAPEIIDAIRRYLSVETKQRTVAVDALARTDGEILTRLERMETILTSQLTVARETKAVATSGRSASRTTAMIAGATAATWVASHYDQVADVLRFLGRFFR